MFTEMMTAQNAGLADLFEAIRRPFLNAPALTKDQRSLIELGYRRGFVLGMAHATQTYPGHSCCNCCNERPWWDYWRRLRWGGES